MSRSPKPPSTSNLIAGPEARWAALDTFLQSTTSLKPVRAKLAKLLDDVRRMGDFGLAEEIEEVGNELRAQVLDRAIVWAFELGRLAGRRERSCASSA